MYKERQKNCLFLLLTAEMRLKYLELLKKQFFKINFAIEEKEIEF